MAPNRKGTKRKSESPPPEEGDMKKYRTRSSIRNKSVSYKEEVFSSEAEEVPQKAESGHDSNFEGGSSSSSSEEEKVPEEVESSSNENSKKKSSPYFSSVSVARNRRNAAATNNGKVKKNLKLAVAAASQKQVFKPVNLDQVDIQAEVNLSGSDSEDNSCSSSDDDFIKNIKKKKSPSKPKTATEEVDEEESGENAVSEQQEDAALDAWSSNLEALNNCQPKASTSNNTTEEAPTVPSAVKAKGKSSRQPKASKTKTEKKKPSPSKRAVKAGGERLPSNVVELLKAEKNDQELSSEDDENWEKVAANSSSPNGEGDDYQLPAEGVEIVLAGGQTFGRKRKGPDIQNLIRLKINRIRREVQLDLHQVSLVAHLAHGYLANKMLNDPTLMATALSIVPSSGFPPTRTDLNYLEKFVKWTKQHFEIVQPENEHPPIRLESIMTCIGTGKAQSAQELVYVCVALCRALGIRTRLVISLQPVSSKVPMSQLVQGKSGGKEKEEPDEEDEPIAKKKEPKGKGKSKKKEPDSDEDTSPKTKKPKVPPKKQVKTKSEPSTSKEKAKTGPSPSKQKRSRRKSAEKPVKYLEPDDDSDFEEEKPKRKSAATKAAKPSKKIISPDSDDEEFKLEVPRRKKHSSDVWLEVYLEQEEQWISVDVPSGKVHCEDYFEKNTSEALLYVVAFNADLTWKDVTVRYASSFLSTTRKQRAHPGWTELIAMRLEKPSRISKEEDATLEKSLNDRPMPTSITELKGHPLYALQRHLLKFEAIYPPTSIPVGYIRGEPVYARECVKTLHSRETWIKEAKVVRVGEVAYKVVKARPKWDRNLQKVITDQPLDVFGEWQVEDYIPPPAVDGKVPRNAYGNVELFKPEMLPKGTVHIQIQGLNKVARRLGIDCAPAMVGWDSHGGWSHPVFDGYIVCEEHVEMLMDAWQVSSEEEERREREKREKRVYGNWRRLIRGLLIRERIQAKYFRKLTEEEDEVPPDEEAPPEEKTPVTAGPSSQKKTVPKPAAAEKPKRVARFSAKKKK